MKEKILIVDDEEGIQSSLRGILEDEGYSVKSTDTGEKALSVLKGENFDLVLLDIWLPQKNGLKVLEEIKTFDETIQVVMITGHGSVESAVKATKMGAYDFLEKPLSLEKVVLTSQNAIRQKKLEDENIQLRERVKSKYHLIGNSPSIQKLRTEINRVAPTNGRVLLYGENGTGKELIARLIHQQSQRKNNRFISIYFGAIPDDLIEFELFGRVKGTFSNSSKDKKGKLLLADGGTLFLDEIGEMSLATQAKLISIIEEQKFEPVGSSGPVSIDTRIIASTNKNLKELITKGDFKEELYYKLSVLPLVIPSLRERKEDIPFLINYFLKYFSLEYGKKQKHMSQEAMNAFINHSWPGNVSELMNVIERFVIMVPEEEINGSHLSLLVEPRESMLTSNMNEFHSLNKAREQFEREYIHKTLVTHNWNFPKAASTLNMDVNQLHQKIKSLGISFLG